MSRKDLDRSVALPLVGSIPLPVGSISVPVLGSFTVPDPFDDPAAFAARVAVGVSFWVGVALPVALLVMLAGGIQRPTDVTAFLGLVAINCAALVAGRGYAAPESRDG